MAIVAARLTVTTSPTLLTVGTESDFTPGRTAAVHNPGPTEVLLGGPSVSADTGMALGAGVTMGLELGGGDAIYGIVASGSQIVHVMQAGV